MIPFTDLKTQYLEVKTDIDAAIARVIDSTSYITGPLVDEFETKFAEFCGAEACAATGSGTIALFCALSAVGIEADDEVITTPHTFISTSEAIIWHNAKPVFVDIDEYYQIDVDKIEAAITDKTRAILFVDMYGQTPDIKRLRDIADRHNLWLIEDAAHSIGAKYNDVPVGSLADLTCVSFNPVKNLGAMGDAGALVGRRDLIEKARMYRDHGRIIKWDFDLKGLNGRIDNIQAQIVLAKMPHLQRWIEGKRSICEYYTEQLRDFVKTPKQAPWAWHSYYVYVIEVAERDKFVEYMKQNGVIVNIHYMKSLTEQRVFADYPADCPITEQACRDIVSLPCYHNLSRKDQDHIIHLIKEWAKNNG
jgi:dTDP-4-amino-4,6-dideoxygalactose transaminase